MENNQQTVPYIAFESAQARAERITKRLIIALVLAVVLIFASNAAWLWAWMQYDYVSDSTTTETVTVDGEDGTANYASKGGSIVNGAYNCKVYDPAHPFAIQEGHPGDP